MLTFTAEQIAEIERHARNIRRNVIRMIAAAGSGHPAGSLSIVDVLACLYFGIMHYDPHNPNDPNRDLLVLSNGHVCPALYATMAEAGIIPESELLTLRQFGSRLQGHPERTKLPGLETTSGPLGEGLSQAAGMAYAMKYLMPANSRRVYCIISDGELNEGSIWEAAMFAGKYRLDNLTIIVDVNGIQLSGATKDVMPTARRAAALSGMRLNVYHAFQGNDVTELLQVIAESLTAPTNHLFRSDAPDVILARTTPGKGVSFMENDYHWHGQAPSPDEAKRALAELEDK